jgi:hypothetical protein
VDFRSRHEDPTILARSDELVRDLEREEKSAALRTQIERSDRPATELLLQVTTGSRKRDIWSHRGENQEFHVLRSKPCLGERDLRRSACEIRRPDALLRIVPRANAGPSLNFCSGKPEILREVSVGYTPTRQEVAHAYDLRHVATA